MPDIDLHDGAVRIVADIASENTVISYGVEKRTFGDFVRVANFGSLLEARQYARSAQMPVRTITLGYFLRSGEYDGTGKKIQ